MLLRLNGNKSRKWCVDVLRGYVHHLDRVTSPDYVRSKSVG